MKIVSFNVNGIKSLSEYVKEEYGSTLNDYLKDILKADIACFQEVKSTTRHMENYNSMKDYITFTNLNLKRKGIYGVSTFVRKNSYCRRHKIDVPFSDHGRTILTDHGSFKVLNIYFPFYDEGGSKDQREVYEFYDRIKGFMDEHDDLIVCGDLNAVYNVFDHFIYLKEYYRFDREEEQAHGHSSSEYIERYSNIVRWNLRNEDFANQTSKESDLKEHLESLYKKGLSRYLDFIRDTVVDIPQGLDLESDNPFSSYRENLIEKRYFSKTELPYLLNSRKEVVGLLYSTYQRYWLLRLILELKYIDVYRMYCAEYHKYTCWNTLLNLRATNQGTRIDYILVPCRLIKHVQGAGICPTVFGSDHCPTFAILDITAEGKEKNILNSKNNILEFFKRV